MVNVSQCRGCLELVVFAMYNATDVKKLHVWILFDFDILIHFYLEILTCSSVLQGLGVQSSSQQDTPSP